jgi:hypothetical protein
VHELSRGPQSGEDGDKLPDGCVPGGTGNTRRVPLTGSRRVGATLGRAGLSLVAVRELLASFDIDSDEHLIHHTGYVAVVVNLSKLKERIEEPPLVPDQPTAPSLSIVQ